MASSQETRSRRGGGSTARTPSLPTELWAEVAGFMSTRSWVKASGTCRAMKAVEPPQISLIVKQPAVASWLAAHWGSARTLKLELLLRESSQSPWCIPRGSRPLSSLLLLDLRSDADFLLACAAKHWLTGLLLQATNLTDLRIARQRCLPIPPLSNLQHLNLKCMDFGPNVFDRIRQLSQLKTLRLSSYKDEKREGTLDLTGLQLLERLSIEGMRQAVVCRVGCLVHIRATLPIIQSYGPMDCGVNALYVSAWDDSHRTTVEPPQLIVESGCSVLQWCFRGNLGSKIAPFDFVETYFGNLHELYLIGTVIHIHLPSSIPLCKLHVKAPNFRLTCDDVSKLAQSLEELSIVVNTGIGFDSCVVNLSNCLNRLGKCTTACITPERHFAMLLEGCRLVDGIFKWPCKCGACPKCLSLV